MSVGHLPLPAGDGAQRLKQSHAQRLEFQWVTFLGLWGLSSESGAAEERWREALRKQVVGEPNGFQSTSGNIEPQMGTSSRKPSCLLHLPRKSAMVQLLPLFFGAAS